MMMPATTIIIIIMQHHPNHHHHLQLHLSSQRYNDAVIWLLFLRRCAHGNVCVYAQYAFSKKSSVHMHLFHLTCLFKRDRWKRWTRCSTYAGTVSGAVTSATKYTKSSEEDSRAAPQQCCHGYPSVYAPRWI